MFTLNKASSESIYDNYAAMCERCACKPATVERWKMITKS
jgi:hypothetical protein